MSQLELDCAVAVATDESVDTIRMYGFSETDADDEVGDDEPALVLDCPFCGSHVLLSTTGPEDLPIAAECVSCDTMFDYQNAEIYARSLDEVVINRTCRYLPMAA